MKRVLRRLNPKTRLAQMLVVAAVAVVSMLAGALSVQAISDTLPDDGSDHFLIVSRYGNGVYLQAPVTYAKLVFPRVPDSARIFDGPYCGRNRGGQYDTSTPDPGSCARPPAALRVWFEFQTMDASGNLVGPIWRVRGDDMAVGGWSTITLRSLAVAAPDSEGNHLVRLKVYWEDPTPDGRYDGGINAFKVDLNGTGSYTTYATLNTDTYPLAVMQRPSDLTAPYKYSNFNFQFAPDCDLSTSTIRRDLKWFDADSNSFNQSGSIWWTLRDDTTGAQVASVSNSKLGGNSQVGTYPFTFVRGHKYTWTWHHVDSRNGVQLWLPFDAYNYVKRCYNVTASIQPVPSTNTPGNGGLLRADGTEYALNPRMTNQGPDTSDPVTMTVSLPVCARFTSATNNGVRTGQNAAGYGGTITWPAVRLARGQSITGNQFRFRINPACDGQRNIRFTVTAAPSGTNTPATASISYNVGTPHYPSVIGLSGDVHAGGGICGTNIANNRNTVTGHQSSNSVGEYVVSASGSVSNFGSNNAPGGTAATLGRTGNYYTVCRPDLVTAARRLFATNTGYRDLNSVPGFPNVDVGTLSEGVYISNGGQNVRLHGTFTRKITIVALRGDIEITGPIQLNAPNVPGSQAPSLGIIAANDIFINGAATRVDAYMFADGTINTCREGNAAACQNTLDVNGFLMARGISFRRLGPSTSASQLTVGERINLAGQIYLNPPVLFDSAAEDNLLRNLGERPPLN